MSSTESSTTEYAIADRVKTANGWVVVYATSVGDFGNHYVGFGFASSDEVVAATVRHLDRPPRDEWAGIRTGMITGRL